MNKNEIIEIRNISKLKEDVVLDSPALSIIEANDYQGVITSISGDIFFVSFKNDLGWVTQGFKKNEIKEVK